MIAICGLPTKNFDSSLVETAFQAYRNNDQRATLLATLGAYGMYDAKITMVGVRDTVGSLGIPSVIAPVTRARYTIPLQSKYALDELHPSWTPLYGFPKSRTIPSDSCFSNSVAVRCQNDASYRPSNLVLDNGVPAAAYSLTPLVT